MDAKSIFTSKTFWSNVALFALAYAKVLPPDYAALVIAVANVALRFLAKGPVSILGS
jgi:hypothetical protein